MTTLSVPAVTTARTSTVPRYVTFSAWAAPIMVVGGFAMIAVLPVVLTTFGVLRHARLADLRWSAALLVTMYGIPLATYLLRDDPAESLTSDMHPVNFALIVAAAVVHIVNIRRHRA